MADLSNLIEKLRTLEAIFENDLIPFYAQGRSSQRALSDIKSKNSTYLNVYMQFKEIAAVSFNETNNSAATPELIRDFSNAICDALLTGDKEKDRALIPLRGSITWEFWGAAHSEYHKNFPLSEKEARILTKHSSLESLRMATLEASQTEDLDGLSDYRRLHEKMVARVMLKGLDPNHF